MQCNTYKKLKKPLKYITSLYVITLRERHYLHLRGTVWVRKYHIRHRFLSTLLQSVLSQKNLISSITYLLCFLVYSLLSHLKFYLRKLDIQKLPKNSHPFITEIYKIKFGEIALPVRALSKNSLIFIIFLWRNFVALINFAMTYSLFFWQSFSLFSSTSLVRKEIARRNHFLYFEHPFANQLKIP